MSVTGKKFVLALYGGQRLATLDEYRYYAYKMNIASKSIGATVTLAALPPTRLWLQTSSHAMCCNVFEMYGDWLQQYTTV